MLVSQLDDEFWLWNDEKKEQGNCGSVGKVVASDTWGGEPKNYER